MEAPGSCTIGDLLFHGGQDPGHNAIECLGHAPLTYQDLRDQVLSVMQTLNANGFHRNDRIAVITPAGPETAVMIPAVMAGFTCIPLDPRMTLPEYETVLPRLDVKAVIVQHGCNSVAESATEALRIPLIGLVSVPGRAGRFTLVPAPVPAAGEAVFASPTDVSHIFLTSGTTSRPKIVPITQRQSFITRQKQVKALNISKSDRCLQILPYFHGMGIGIPLLATFLAGGTVICTREFIPSDFPVLLDTCRPTFFIGGPAHHTGILREIRKVPFDYLKNSSLRFILTSSSVLPANVCEGLEKLLGVPVIEQYATSETGVISFNLHPRRGSVGIPVIDAIRLLDQNGNAVSPNREGEIVVKGDTVFSGYEDAPEENAAAFTDGWFRTGDTGYLDERGYLYLTGRKKELINKGGQKISPAEIDDVLMAHPGIRETMTFPVEDPVLGEDIAVMIVREQETLSEDDIRRFLLDRITPSKLPRRIFFVDGIPKTPTGKPMRNECTRRYS